MKLGQTGGPDPRLMTNRETPVTAGKITAASTTKVPIVRSPLPSNPVAMLDQSLMHAFQAASLPLNDALLARMALALHSQAARVPSPVFPRLARVLLEMELRGQLSSPKMVDRLLTEPDLMGLTPQESVSLGRQGSDGGMTDQGDSRGGQRQPEMNAEQLAAFLGHPVCDEKGRQISPAWNIYKLESLSWSSGGNLRWSAGPRGTCMNIDIVTPEGVWQFHWFEPHRTRIVVGVPAGSSLKKKQKQWLHMLESIVGPLGFKEFHTLKPNDWYDGFNFLSAESILRRVDVVV